MEPKFPLSIVRENCIVHVADLLERLQNRYESLLEMTHEAV